MSLTPDQASYFRGTLYNRRKGRQGGDHRSKSQSATLIDTASEIAAAHGVHRATIIRDGKRAEAIDRLAARCLLAEALAERLKPKAKENLKASGGDRKSSKAKSGSPILGKAIDTLKQAAKEAGVSHGTLAAFRMVQKHADGATMAELLTNPEKKLHRVAKDIKENQAKAARQRKD